MVAEVAEAAAVVAAEAVDREVARAAVWEAAEAEVEVKVKAVVWAVDAIRVLTAGRRLPGQVGNAFAPHVERLFLTSRELPVPI